jgi:pyruvate kinase
LVFALAQDVDFVALSFVRSAADVKGLRARIEKAGSKAMVIAKIERREAVRDLAEILAVSDGLMVARGDMGVELGVAKVPMIQKRIIKLANQAGKPVITATQMLESMTHNPRPTRAEASDVANAIVDATSAVMLSGETASGRHPALVVRTLDRLIRMTEKEIFTHYEYVRRRRMGSNLSIDHATVRAAAYAALEVGAKLIVVFTESGRTARMMAQEQMPIRIVAFTPNERTYRQLTLSWGINSEMLPAANSRAQLLYKGEKRLMELGLAKSGDRVVFIAGVTRVSGATNMMTIREVHVS